MIILWRTTKCKRTSQVLSPKVCWVGNIYKDEGIDTVIALNRENLTLGKRRLALGKWNAQEQMLKITRLVLGRNRHNTDVDRLSLKIGNPEMPQMKILVTTAPQSCWTPHYCEGWRDLSYTIGSYGKFSVPKITTADVTAWVKFHRGTREIVVIGL